jgi:hypothetical protein
MVIVVALRLAICTSVKPASTDSSAQCVTDLSGANWANPDSLHGHFCTAPQGTALSTKVAALGNTDPKDCLMLWAFVDSDKLISNLIHLVKAEPVSVHVSIWTHRHSSKHTTNGESTEEQEEKAMVEFESTDRHGYLYYVLGPCMCITATYVVSGSLYVRM